MKNFLFFFLALFSVVDTVVLATTATWDLAGVYESVDDVSPFCSPPSCYIPNKVGGSSCSCPPRSSPMTIRLLNNCNGPNTLHGGDVTLCHFNTFNSTATSSASQPLPNHDKIFGGAFQIDDQVPYKTTGCRSANPITGACTCPTGFSSASSTYDVFSDCGTQGCAINTKVSFCVKNPGASSPLIQQGLSTFAGVYLESSTCISGNVLVGNNNCSCPSWADSNLTTRIPILNGNPTAAADIVICSSKQMQHLPKPPPTSDTIELQVYPVFSESSSSSSSPRTTFGTVQGALNEIETLRQQQPEIYMAKNFSIVLLLAMNTTHSNDDHNVQYLSSPITISPLAGGSQALNVFTTMYTGFVSSPKITPNGKAKIINKKNGKNFQSSFSQTKVILSGGVPISPNSWTPSQTTSGIFELQLTLTLLNNNSIPSMVWHMFEFDKNSGESTRVSLHASQTVQYKNYDISTNIVTMNPGVPPLPKQYAPEKTREHQQHEKSIFSSFFTSKKMKKSDVDSSSSSSVNPLASAYVYLYHSWTSSISQIGKYAPSQNEFWVEGSVSDNVFNTAAAKRFRIVNILHDEANMKPGTFTFDKNSSILKYRPSSASAVPKTVVIPILPTVLSASHGAENVIIDHVEFAHTDPQLDQVCIRAGCCGQSGATLPNVALDLYSSHTTITDCNIRHTGQYAAWIRNGPFVKIHGRDTKIEDLGAGGVRIGGPSSAAVSSTVADVTIRNGGFLIEAGTGILAQQVASCTITHNEIHDLYYTGVSVGWDWSYTPTQCQSNIVSYNKIYNIGRGRLSDMGCVYHLGLDAGAIIENNECFNVQTSGYGAWGYYLDQATSYTIWRNNIVYSTKAAGLHVHFGLYNLLTNNILAFPRQVLNAAGNAVGDFAGLRSSPSSSGFESITQFNFVRNIILQDNASATLFFGTTDAAFSNTTFQDNIYFNMDKSIGDLQFPPLDGWCTSWACWQQYGKDTQGSSRANPQFAGNPEQTYDFSSFMASSPALKIGFVPIHQSEIGPR